jgi:hypothetical protein
MNGGERTKVCEHLSVVYFEVEACPEPKRLKKSDLKSVLEGLGTVAAVAKHTGLGWSATTLDD